MTYVHKAITTHATDEIPVWKTKQYLAGVIDSEGSFIVALYTVRGLNYLWHSFEIKMMATKEWVQTANYWKSIYGGTIYQKMEDGLFYRWTIRETETLLRFLNDIIPYLNIKRTDAENVRKSLIAYQAIKDKGKLPRKYWEEWIRKHGLRRWVWGTP